MDEPDHEPLDVYRPSEAQRLRDALTTSKKGLTIFAVSGAGGVGKSYLVEHVLADVDVERRGRVVLRLDGSNPRALGDFFGLVDGQLCRRSLPPPADPKADYFPHVRRVAELHRHLVATASRELEQTNAPKEVKAAATALLKTGVVLNRAIPKTKKVVDLAALDIPTETLEDVIDRAWEMASALDALRDATWIPGPLRDKLGMTRRGRVRRDLYNLVADELLTDLAAMITGYRPRDFFRFTQEPIEGAQGLVLVIDDYEAVAPTIEDFLVGSLVPRLADAPFVICMVVVGRDDLEATHPGWGQHCKRYLADQVRLQPFDESTATRLMEEAGIAPERRERIWELTEGFPFLLSLAIEEEVGDGSSALFLRKFFDRTTRWMTDTETEWFTRICHLDEVNEDTLARVIDDTDLRRVQDWFEREASIRDPSAEVFVVRPLIRDKVLRYLKMRAPSEHRRLAEAAARSGDR